MLHKYPFKSRLILFTAPALTVFVAAGLDYIWTAAGKQGRLIGATLAAILLLAPVTMSATRFAHPPPKHEMRPLLAQIAARHYDGQIFFIAPFTEYAFKFYQDRCGLPGVRPRLARESYKTTGEFLADLQSLRGNARVWLIFEEDEPVGAQHFDREQFATYLLDQMGRRVEAIHVPGDLAYCYDLSQ